MSKATYLWNLDDRASHDDSQSQSFGQGILEATCIGHIGIVNKDSVTPFSDDSHDRVSDDGGEIASDGSELVMISQSAGYADQVENQPPFVTSSSRGKGNWTVGG